MCIRNPREAEARITHLHIFEEASSVVLQLRVQTVKTFAVKTRIVRLREVRGKIVLASFRC